MSQPAYINNVTLTMNDNRSEFVMTLKQNYPLYDENGNVIGQAADTAASVVFSAEMAKRIHNAFDQLLKEVDEADG